MSCNVCRTCQIEDNGMGNECIMFGGEDIYIWSVLVGDPERRAATWKT
jgi:hypothetical protein